MANSELLRAWQWREERGAWAEASAGRVFHGPGESSGPLKHWAVDRFGDCYWVTRWEAPGEAPGAEKRALSEISGFLRAQGASSAVWLGRPQKGVPQVPEILFGEPPRGRFEVREAGARYWIQCLEARHPGLFLDHAPLRQWLRARARGLRVLNTFAYTGSLSVACGLAGAAHVTTLDLSKPTVQWAEDNWLLNGLEAERARFISGDVFEWLPRLKREGREFDCMILDPPSFSRGNKGTFSTAKDLARLHELGLDLLADGGILVTSINSANVTWAKYEAEVLAAARARKARLSVLGRIEQPDTFATRLGDGEGRYLKGWMLRVEK